MCLEKFSFTHLLFCSWLLFSSHGFWQNQSAWQLQCLLSACPKDLTPTAVDLTPTRPASSLSAEPPFPHRLLQSQTASSCRKSSMLDLCCERVSSGVCSPWPTRRFSSRCMRTWRWRQHLGHQTLTCWTFRCPTCTLPLGCRKRLWSDVRMWYHSLLTYEHWGCLTSNDF